MTFGECKNRIMQLAFSYSLAGTLIPDSYNNQADYLAMIPGLINTADSAELDNTKDTHECIPYYAASRILLYDNAYRSAELMNEYREKIAKLREPVWLESGVIANVYQGESYY